MKWRFFDWLILISIGLGTSLLIFLIVGVGGGFFLLVALNGFSQSQALPILGGFAACNTALALLISSGIAAFIVRRWLAPRVGLLQAFVVNTAVVLLFFLSLSAVLFIMGRG